ncbi:MAG: sulfite exporter TauE/SafE family protein [Saprospiraceae bacterium]|nr:sulfite exporter TauE/SafE family protein [Saprospiraceae bacterium]
MEWYLYLIAILGGALAGAINTLAGNGSAITLTILTEILGLPGNIANGTNRVGVLTQSVAGSWAFHKFGKLDLSRSKLNIALTFMGAIIGVLVAIQVSNEQFMFVFKYLMLAMLVVLLVKPSRWLKETDPTAKVNLLFAIPLYLALGFYGGFIQMGMGIFYLATMVIVARYSIIEGNALKSFIVALYTLCVLGIFHYKGLVRWDLGAILAIGQTFGGWYTATFASKFSGANRLAYWLLVIIVIAASLRLFGFAEFDFFQ